MSATPSSSHWSQDGLPPDANYLAFQLILEDQEEGFEAFRRRHERRQRRLERDLLQIQQMEANGGKLPNQKWMEMEKQQLQEERNIRHQQQQRKEEEVIKQQQLQQEQRHQSIKPMSSLLHPSRTLSLYPSTDDVSSPTTSSTPALSRHRSEGWSMSRSRTSSSSLCNDPSSSPFTPRPTRQVGWSIVDDEGCLVLETPPMAGLPSMPSMRNLSLSPPPTIHGRRPGGPDLSSDDGLARARRGSKHAPIELRRPPSPPPPQPNRRASSQPASAFIRMLPSPPRPNRPSQSSVRQEKLYRKIVPIFPQVAIERIMQLVREQHEQHHGDDDDDDEEEDERLLSTILSILAEESLPLQAEGLVGIDSISPTSKTSLNPRECQCCYTEWSETDSPVMIPCTGTLHVFCLTCVQKYVQEVVFGNLPIPVKDPVRGITTDEPAWVLPCLYANTSISSGNQARSRENLLESPDLCRHGLDDLVLQHVLPTSLWQGYQEYQISRALLSTSSSQSDEVVNVKSSNEQLQYCPHCGVPCLVPVSSSPQSLACPSCGKEACWNTSSTSAPVTRTTSTTSSTRTTVVEPPSTTDAGQLEDAGRHYVEEVLTQTMLRSCPKCLRPFVKESGCHKMKCPFCRTASCYVCRQVLPWKGYDHFCTHEQHSVDRACVECGPKCALWSPLQSEGGYALRPISQRRASARTRRGRRRTDLPEFLNSSVPSAGARNLSLNSDDSEGEEELRRKAGWEAAQVVWEQNLLATGQEIRVDVEELIRMPPSLPAPASLGGRHWTR